MIGFTLSVMFCVSATNCQWWKDRDFYISESTCHALGKSYLASDPQVLIYKCTIELRDWR